MSNRLRIPTSLRLRLVLVILLASIPAGAVYGFEFFRQQEAQRGEAEHVHLDRAEAAAAEQATFLLSLNIMMGLTGPPAFGDGDGCEEELVESWVVQPGVAGLAIYDIDQTFICGVGALQGDPALHSLSQAEATGDLAGGRYTETDAGPILDLAIPVWDESLRLLGYMTLAVDLLWWSERVGVGASESAVAVIDEGANVVAVNSDAGALGDNVRDNPLGALVLAGQERQGHAQDRFWSVFPVPLGPGQLFLAVGDPPDRVYASVSPFPAPVVVAGALALAFSLAMAWVLVGRLVIRPVQHLSAAAQRLGDGDVSARTGMTGDEGEVGQVGVVFDRMAARMEDQEAWRRQFIGTVAHDLMNPIQPVVLRLYLLKQEGDLTEKQQAHVEALEHSVRRIKYLVQDLADVNKMESGRMAILPTDLDLADLCRRLGEDYTEQAGRAGVTLRVEAEPTPVHADPVRMEQVVSNLLSNALKFTPDGGTVSLRIRPAAAADGANGENGHTDGHGAGDGGSNGDGDRGSDGAVGVHVEVQDSGVGVPSDKMDRLFQPFSQIDNPLQRDHVGTGLGLYICRGIVEGHGGTIGVASDGEGEGATFWFTLPARPPPRSEEALKPGDSPPVPA